MILKYLPRVERDARKVAAKWGFPADEAEQLAMDFLIELVRTESDPKLLKTSVNLWAYRRLTRIVQKERVIGLHDKRVEMPSEDAVPAYEEDFPDDSPPVSVQTAEYVRQFNDLLSKGDRKIVRNILNDVRVKNKTQKRWDKSIKPVLRKWMIENGVVEGELAE